MPHQPPRRREDWKSMRWRRVSRADTTNRIRDLLKKRNPCLVCLVKLRADTTRVDFSVPNLLDRGTRQLLLPKVTLAGS
ncbi:hypothetical protein DsansV1_C01g0005761 [Dioscorea sansibarensis]